MVVSRKALAIFTVLMMFACTVPIVSGPMESEAAGDNDGVLLYQVNPWGKSEGFTLRNYSSGTVDIKGFTVSDGEGSIVFQESFRLGASDTVTVVMKKTDEPFSKQANVHTPGEMGILKQKSFGLSNSGDDVVLTDGSGALLDSFYYGSYSKDMTGWVGETVSIKKDFFSERSGSYDSDSADDWFNSIPGQTKLPLELKKFKGDVTPFLFPESGGIPVYRALENAQDSVLIEIYMLTNANLCGLLLDLQNRGVQVSILHEGNPIGVDILDYIVPTLNTIVKAGGHVKFIETESGDRYENVHCKYAVIDGKTVVVTSENWTKENLNGSLDDNILSGDDGNRGWGAVVDSPGYAGYMADVFRNDSDTSYGDVYALEERYPYAKTKTLTYTAPADADFKTYRNVDLTPVLSNDNSGEAMDYFIDNAQKRVYSQQQNLTKYFADPTDDKSPIYKMAQKAAAGLDVRFILGEGVGTDNANQSKSNVSLINSSTLISAATMSDPYVHNKGLICDDAVWVSSINWTPTSVFNNRECCIVIHSQGIADFFADSFLKDFDRNYSDGGLRVDTSELQSSYLSGQETVFEVTVLPEGEYTYHWDFGDGGVRDTTIPKVAYTPADGAHVLKVTVTSADGTSMTVEKDYYVGDDPSDPDVPVGPDNPSDPDVPVGPDNPSDPNKPVGPDDSGESVIPGVSDEELSNFLPYLVPILAILIAICLAISKMTGKKKSKGKKRK